MSPDLTLVLCALSSRRTSWFIHSFRFGNSVIFLSSCTVDVNVDAYVVQNKDGVGINVSVEVQGCLSGKHTPVCVFKPALLPLATL